MNLARVFCLAIILILVLVASDSRAKTVTYTLDDVVLAENSSQMTGSFTWTFDVGDFENGSEQFISLEVPFTLHDHTKLKSIVDVGNSIEITLEGNAHDDGVDITLFLLAPLTPSASSSLDLARSEYDIGGNGFHAGSFLSGSISPMVSAPSLSGPALLALAGLLLAINGYNARRFHLAGGSGNRTGPIAPSRG